MLRSHNSAPIIVPNTASQFRLVSVSWDGPAIVGGLMVCRSRFRSLVNTGTSGFRFSVVVVRHVTVVASILVQASPTVIGQTCELPWSQLVDLVPGDVIALHAGSPTIDNWELVEGGFSVDVR